MFKHDGEELAGLVIGLIAVVLIVYAIIIVASILLSVATVGGTIFGGGSAIKNYVSSFKENVIDSNRSMTAAA